MASLQHPARKTTTTDGTVRGVHNMIHQPTWMYARAWKDMRRSWATGRVSRSMLQRSCGPDDPFLSSPLFRCSSNESWANRAQKLWAGHKRATQGTREDQRISPARRAHAFKVKHLNQQYTKRRVKSSPPVVCSSSP